MLTELIIENVALIKQLKVQFDEKLNILSGETGAGKSIIIDSLMLLLGQKYDKNILRYGANQGFVEGVFSLEENQREALKEFGIDCEDDYIIVNRKFNDASKNEIRINGRITTLSMLKNVMETFVDIYGQHEYFALAKKSEHLKIIDNFIKNDIEQLKKTLSLEYNKLSDIKKELSKLGNLSDRERTIDLLKYQIEEIEKANVKKDEEESLVSERKLISSAENIIQSLNESYNALSGYNSKSVAELVSIASGNLFDVASFSKEYNDLATRLESVEIEINDILEDLSGQIDNIDFDEKDLDKIENRLNKIRDLKRKYGEYDAMNKYLRESKEQLYMLENCAELFEKLVSEKAHCLKNVYKLCLELSAKRKEGSVKFKKLIETELHDLGMEHAVFDVNFEDFPTLENCEKSLTSNGLDEIEFYFSANKGQPAKPFIKIISGGEMSRFMLALKVVTSELDDINTMIFDEIDSGISGIIGQSVAKKLAKISRNHQVICITHLPQIASMADKHYLIKKESDANETVTKVTPLEYEQQIDEISRLSGAKDISSASIANATEMKKWSNTFKNTI